MANYQRCNIRVYPNSGTIALDSFKKKVAQLKLANNIQETIQVYHLENLSFAEIRYTAKRYPTMLTEIFDLEENDLWILRADEGGSSDSIRFETRNKAPFSEFCEKAIYSFDEIRLLGVSEVIKANSKAIFGFGIKDSTFEEIDNGIKLSLHGLYTGNNFFYQDAKGDMTIESFDQAIKEELKNETGEFWELLFHLDGIEFKEKFYDIVQHQQTGIRDFPYLDRIEFYHQQRLSNRLEWSINGGMDYWKHASNDGFWNCGNAKFYAYELLKK